MRGGRVLAQRAFRAAGPTLHAAIDRCIDDVASLATDALRLPCGVLILPSVALGARLLSLRGLELPMGARDAGFLAFAGLGSPRSTLGTCRHAGATRRVAFVTFLALAGRGGRKGSCQALCAASPTQLLPIVGSVRHIASATYDAAGSACGWLVLPLPTQIAARLSGRRSDRSCCARHAGHLRRC